MNNDFKSFIKNNPSIITTLFHVNESNIKVVNDNMRIINKCYKTNKLFTFIPILKDMLQDILKDVNGVDLKIIEKYDEKKVEFNYEIKLCENKLFDNITNLYKFSYFILMSQDKINKNKINASIAINKNNVEDDINPLNKIIIMLMINYFENEQVNYYKQVVFENQLKPLIQNLSHHSFELNIV